MGKVYNAKPEFLTVRLEPKDLTLVSAQFPKWHAKAKLQPDFKSQISMPLLYSFVDYLGKKN